MGENEYKMCDVQKGINMKEKMNVKYAVKFRNLSILIISEMEANVDN